MMMMMMIMIVEQLVEWELAGEIEVLGEDLPSATSSTKNPTWLDVGSNPGHRCWKLATNCLSHGTASVLLWAEERCREGCRWCTRRHNILSSLLSELTGFHSCSSRRAPLGSDYFYHETPLGRVLDLLFLVWRTHVPEIYLHGQAAVSCHGLSRSLHWWVIKLTIKNKKGTGSLKKRKNPKTEIQDSAGTSVSTNLPANDWGLLEIPLIR
jgi:hypothetical protein